MDSGKKAEFMTWQQELIEQQEIGKEKAELDSIISHLKTKSQGLMIIIMIIIFF